jgi:hypothetical protein
MWIQVSDYATNQELTLVLALDGVLFLANREMGQRLDAAVYGATDEQSIHVTWLDMPDSRRAPAVVGFCYKQTWLVSFLLGAGDALVL